MGVDLRVAEKRTEDSGPRFFYGFRVCWRLYFLRRHELISGVSSTVGPSLAGSNVSLICEQHEMASVAGNAVITELLLHTKLIAWAYCHTLPYPQPARSQYQNVRGKVIAIPDHTHWRYNFCEYFAAN